MLAYCILLLAGCSKKDIPAGVLSGSASAGKLKSEDDLSEKRIGVLMGSLYDKYASDKFPNATILHFQSIPEQLMALKSGKIDVVYYGQVSAPDMLKANPDLGYLAKDVFFVPIGVGFNRDNDKLRVQFNEFQKEIRSDGIYDDMVSRWMVKGEMEMPVINATSISGQLRTGIVNDMGMPFGFIHNGKNVGFDIELSSRFAAWLGREYVPVPLAFGTLIASIATNKIDMICSGMVITKERAKMIDFSDP